MSNFISSIDQRTAQFFLSIRSDKLTAFFKAVTILGSWEIVGVISIIVGIIFLWRKNNRAAIVLWLTLFLNESIVYLLKNTVDRLRPLNALIVETDYSFPSGHSAIAVAFYGFLTFILLQKCKNRGQKIVIVTLAILLIFLIGISRLYLGVHYATDIIGGYVVGGSVLIIAIRFLLK